MSETLYVEGSDQESVCRRILAEYGRDIRFLSLERVRRGGVGGFFAREVVGVRFELVGDETAAADQLETPTTAADHKTPAIAADFLAGLANDSGFDSGIDSRLTAPAATSGPVRAGGPTAPSVRPAPSEAEPVARPAQAPPVAGGSVYDWADEDDWRTEVTAVARLAMARADSVAVRSHRRPEPAPEFVPAVATLPRVAATDPPVAPSVSSPAPAAPYQPATAERVGRHAGGRPGAITLTDLVALVERDDREPMPAGATGGPRRVGPDNAPTAAALGRVAATLADAAATLDDATVGAASFATTLGAARARLTAAPATALAPAAESSPPVPVAAAAASVPTVPTEVSTNPTGVAAAGPDALRPPAPRTDALADLREIGVPVWASPDLESLGLYRAIEQAIIDLPPAPRPPSRAGEILAIVGPLDVAMETAAAVARELRVSPDDVWVAGAPGASPRRISGPLDAARRAVELRGTDLPALVVVATDDIANDAAEFGWVAQVLAALGPAAVWAVVDARRKTADIRATLARYGGVDAVVAHGAAQTATPGSIWELDIPVARIDGEPATAGRWAALLFDRLAQLESARRDTLIPA